MTTIPDSIVPCPEGFAESRIAGLVADASDAEAVAHTHTCGACAEAYLEHLVVSRAARRLAREAVPSIRARWVRRRPWTLSRLPVAAALLITVGAAATATVALLRRTSVVPAVGFELGRISDLQARSHCDLAASGLGPDAIARKWCTHVGPDGGLASVLVASSPDLTSHDVIGFGSGGEVRWAASNWAGWAETSGQPGVEFRDALNVVVRRDGDALTERLCVMLEGWNKSGALLIDPIDGALAGRYLHEGPFTLDPRSEEHVSSLPTPSGRDRRLILHGRHGFGSGRRPCISVIESDGELVQHLMLPTIGIGGGDGAFVVGCRIDWTPGHESVEARTSESVHFTFSLSNGELDVPTATVSFGDGLSRRIDESLGEPGAWVAWLEAAGGRDRLASDLAGRVVADSPRRLTRWFTR